MEQLTDRIKNKLENMVDETWLYMGRTVRIKGWDAYDGFIIIFNNGNNIKFPANNARAELEEFLPADDSALVGANGSMPALFNGDASNIKKIEDMLMENIDKINEDPAHIETAKAVQQQAKTVLDVQKLKLDMVKEMRKGGI